MKKTADIRRACNNCIKAKAACDNNRPCFRCVSHKLGDTCANVARKHNAGKRRKTQDVATSEGENEHLGNNNTSLSPQILFNTIQPPNLSSIINNSLNTIIPKIENTVTYNYHANHEGEVSGNAMASNVINSAIQNLNTRSTSAIISNAISNLNYYNPAPPNTATPGVPFENNSNNYESVLSWLQTVATTNVPHTSPEMTPPPYLSSPQLVSAPTINGYYSPPQQHQPTPNLNSSIYPNYPLQHSTPLLQQNFSLPHPHSPPLQQMDFQPMQINSPSQQHQPMQIVTPPPPQQHQQHHQQHPQQQTTPISPITSSSSSASSSSPSASAPTSPSLLHSDSLNSSVNNELPPLPTLNITIYTRTMNSNPSSFSYVSNLLKHSPQGPQGDSDTLQQNPAHPHNITIPNCSAGSLVQTLSLLRQYNSIDLNMPVHIDYTYKSEPKKVQPVALIEIAGPTMVDCNDAFAQVFGFDTAREIIATKCPLGEYMLPEGIAFSRRTIDLFFKTKLSKIERYQVFLLKGRPARIFLTQHELVGSHHRTISFVEEFPDFPLCFFSDWIKKILPNAILPPCSRPYCHCKYPDEQATIV